MEPQQNKPSDQETQVKIVLDSLITKLDEHGIKGLQCLDAEVNALLNVFGTEYDLSSFKQLHDDLMSTDGYRDYLKQHSKEYLECYEYAVVSIENSKIDHYKTSS